MRLSSFTSGMLALCLVAGCDDDDVETTPLDGGTDAAVRDAALDAVSPDGAADAAAGPRHMELKFRARLTDKGELVCGQKYSSQGTASSEVTPKDFRFYVQSVKLKATTGEEVPLVFDDLSGRGFQTSEVALVDFTTSGGECQGGPAGSNLSIQGTVPAGLSFNGVSVVIGVPETLNHADPTIAPAPLQAPGASWDWLSGYRFFIAEVVTTLNHDAGTSHGALDAGGQHGGGDAGAGDAGGGHAGSTQPGGLFHLGSVGCTKAGDSISCTNANRAEFTLSNFDPDRDVIEADLGAVFATADLSTNVQCHGMSGGCSPMFGQIGVDIATGKPSGVQKVFSVSSQR